MAKIRLADGYTIDEDTGPVYGLPNIHLKYRAPLPEAVADVQVRQARAGTGKDYVESVVDFLNGRLLGWDLQDEKDQPIPVDAETLKKVPFQILDRVQTVVAGYAMKGKAGADAKNSNPG